MTSTKMIICEDDLIVLGDKVDSIPTILLRVFFSLFLITFGAFLLWNDISVVTFGVVSQGNVSILLRLVYLISGLILIPVDGFIFVGGLYGLLFNGKSVTVTVNKEISNLIINTNYIIKYLNSVEETLFSDIKEIEISRWTSAESSDSWHINLITTKGESKRIYDADGQSDAELIAEKIRKITNKEILTTHI